MAMWYSVIVRPVRRFTSPVSMVLGFSLLAGCDNAATPYQPPLEGVILWEDGTEPRELEGSTVEFESGGEIVAQAGLTADGTFMIEKPLGPGTYRIRLQPPASAQRNVLPARFQSFDQSNLSYTAAADGKPQHATFKLSKAGR
jgi:hypothetical protein